MQEVKARKGPVIAFAPADIEIQDGAAMISSFFPVAHEIIR